MVPDGWKQTNINKVHVMLTSGSRGWGSFYANTGSRFIRITNLRRDNILPDYSKLKYVDLPEGLREGLRTRLQLNDILISITADLGIIGFIDSEPEVPSYINQHIAVMRLNKEMVYPKYIAYFLASPINQYKIKKLNDAGAKAGLNLSTIKNIKLDLPPLTEQKRIAEILTTWDRAIETTEKLITNAEAKKKALMQQLLTGKRRLPKFDGDWKKAFFSEIAKKSSQTFNPLHSPNSFRCIELENIESNTGQILLNNEHTEVSSMKTVFSDRSVLFGKLRPYLKKYAFPGFNGVCSSEIWVLNAEENLCNPAYLFYLVQTDTFLRAASVSSGTKMPRSNWQFVQDTIFHIPNLKEQKEIVTRIDSVCKTAKLLKSNLISLKQEKAALMQQLLTGKRRVKIEEPAT